MNVYLIVSVALATIAFSEAEDDGKYHPQAYGGDDGQYRPSDEGRYLAAKYFPQYNPYHHGGAYNGVFGRNGKINSVFPLYQQAYYPGFQPGYYPGYEPFSLRNFAPYQQYVTPNVAYGDSNAIDQAAFASSLKAVTYRPPVKFAATTARNIIYSSTPKPVAPPSMLPTYANIAAKQYPTRYAEKFANIVRQDNELGQNSYRYLYQTDNGITGSESGNVEPSVNGGGTRAQGFYEYIGDDGLKYRVDYTADENGFRPVGEHLPKK